MHHLITGLASMIVLGLFLSQFVANENVFIETLSVERVINSYVSKEYCEEEIGEKLKEMEQKINSIPHVTAGLEDNRLTVRIDNVIGPSRALGIDDDSIILEKDLELKIKEEDHEESDNSGGTFGSDGTSEQISDGDESHNAVTDLN
ncbi:MAG: hypothetical protein IKS99_06595 [Firmicutes bacterium]|nr:hypothetical protein [Bacillota bacterium]